MIFKGHLHLQLKENGLRMNPIYSSEKRCMMYILMKRNLGKKLFGDVSKNCMVFYRLTYKE